MNKTTEQNNPFSPYRIEFPYTCSFSIPEDGHITRVTIETRSEELRYGRNEKDIRLQKSLENEDGRPTYAKHLLEWVSNHLYSIDPRECEVTYQDTILIEKMTQEQVEQYREECLDL